MAWSATATAGQASQAPLGRRGAGEAGRTVGLTLEDLGAAGRRVCGLPGGWWRHGHPLSWCPGGRGSASGTGSMPIATLPVWPSARHATSVSLL